MPVLNLCETDNYYKTPYVSDSDSDKLRGLPSSVQDISIIQELTDDAIIDLTSSSTCDLYNIASIFVRFKSEQEALIIVGGSELTITAKSGDLPAWELRHEDYSISDAYTIGTIESIHKTKIEGRLHLSDLQSRNAIINNGAIQGTFINARNLGISGEYSYVKNANITCSFAHIVADKARIDNTSIICQEYLQDSEDSSLLNCNIVALSGKLVDGYIVSSELVFNRLSLVGGHISAKLSYDDSLYGFPTFSGVSTSGNNFETSGIPPMIIENTQTDKNFQLEVPLLVVKGDELLNGVISTTLISGDGYYPRIGIDGNVKTDFISGGCINAGILNIDTIINKQLEILNYGQLNIKTLYSDNRLQLNNYNNAITSFDTNICILNELLWNSGIINTTNTLFLNKSSTNYHIINAINLYANKSLSNFGTINSSYVYLSDASNNAGVITAENTEFRDSSSNHGTLACDTALFINGSFNGGIAKGNITFASGAAPSFNMAELDNAIFMGLSFNDSLGNCKSAIFKQASYNIGSVSGVADFYDKSTNGNIKEEGNRAFSNPGAVTIANFYDSSKNIDTDNSLWETLSFYNNSLNGATLTSEVSRPGLIKKITFKDNSYNTGIIRATDKMNLEFFDVSFNAGMVVSGVFKDKSTNFGTAISGTFLNSSVVNGDIRRADDQNNQFNQFCVFKNNSSSIGYSVLGNCKFYDNSFNSSLGGSYAWNENEDLEFYNNSYNRTKVFNVSFFDNAINYGNDIAGKIICSGVGVVNFGKIIGGRPGGGLSNAPAIPTTTEFYSSSTNKGFISNTEYSIFSGNAYNFFPIQTDRENVKIVFIDRCYNSGGIANDKGSVQFQDFSENNGSILSKYCSFFGQSVNFGHITVVGSLNPAAPELSPSCYFDNSTNYGDINAPRVIMSNSINEQKITSQLAMMSSNTQNNSLIAAQETSFSMSVNNYIVQGSGSFTFNSINNGIVSGNAVFTNYSRNEGVVVGLATFDETSINNGIILGASYF